MKDQYAGDVEKDVTSGVIAQRLPSPQRSGGGYRQRGARNSSTAQEQRYRPAAGNATINFAVLVTGQVAGVLTKMLIDTGSAVTLVREDVWNQAPFHSLL